MFPDGRNYSVTVDPAEGWEDRLAGEIARRVGSVRIAILTDQTCEKRLLPKLAAALSAEKLIAHVTVVADGEASKSLGTVERIADEWARVGLDRDTVAIALGGGVVGDLCGFVAATFLRGLRLVQVPTTLLAQVDSSVGGKTAVNLSAGKNLVGAFHQPLLVYAPLIPLSTLSTRDFASGLAELVKHAVISDSALFNAIFRATAQDRDSLRKDPALLADFIARSVRIKAKVVVADEREQTEGGRAILNFGHTVGHAIETASIHSGDPLRHGEAVALGMLAAVRVGAALSLTPSDVETKLRDLFARIGLPTNLDGHLSREVLAHLGVDKKRVGQSIRFVLVEQIGKCRVERLALEKIREILSTVK